MKEKINKRNYRNNIKNNQYGITLVVLIVIVIVVIVLGGIVLYCMLTKMNKKIDLEGVQGETVIDTKSEIKEETDVKTEKNTEIYITDFQKDITKPYLPDKTKFHVSEKDGEKTLADGLVIVDNVGNEYVWIEVPRTDEVYGDILTNYPAITDANRTTVLPLIKAALITYSGFTETGTDVKTTRSGWKDEYYDGCGIVAGNGKTAEENYNSLYNTMLESVYTNGGFYIGRYEAGLDNYVSNSRSSIEGITPISQANKYPINWITCSQAQTIATRVESGYRTSSLMFGLQWDLVIKYLETKGYTTLKTDSENFGNYCNSNYIVEETNVKYIDYEEVWNNGANEEYKDITANNPLKHENNNRYTHTYTLLTTGANTKQGSNASFKMQNIYNFASNVAEWTLEHATSVKRSSCVVRGGNYGVNSSSLTASFRNSCTSTVSYNHIGLRVAIY